MAAAAVLRLCIHTRLFHAAIHEYMKYHVFTINTRMISRHGDKHLLPSQMVHDLDCLGSILYREWPQTTLNKSLIIFQKITQPIFPITSTDRHGTGFDSTLELNTKTSTKET